MSWKSAPYYWLTCDAPDCGVSSTEGSEFSAWQSRDGALVEADDADWYITEDIRDDTGRLIELGRHYCDDHSNNVCRNCHAYDDTRYSGERDYLCVPCAAREGIYLCPECGCGGDMHDRKCTKAQERSA